MLLFRIALTAMMESGQMSLTSSKKGMFLALESIAPAQAQKN